MHLQSVTSSKLQRVGYDEEKQILLVQFPESKQSVYAYLGVDPLLFDGMMEADSLGSFFIKNIRGKNGSPIHQFKKVCDGNLVNDEGEIADGLLEGIAPVPSASAPLFAETVAKGKPLPPAPDIHSSAPAIEGEIMPPASVDTIPELPKKDEELITRALTVQEQAKAFQITSGMSFAQADSWIVTIKRERKLVFDRLDAIVKPALEAYRQAQRLRDESVAPYDEAERILKGSMLGYNRKEQEERRQREQEEFRKRQEQAKREAEEQARIQAEDDARTFEAQGEVEMAASVRANPLPIAPVSVAPVVLEREVPKGASSIREKWAYRNVEEMKLLAHALPGVPQAQLVEVMRFFSVDPKKLKSYATTMKLLGTIPGAIEVYDEGTIATRTA